LSLSPPMPPEGQDPVLHIITFQGTDVPHAIPSPNSPRSVLTCPPSFRPIPFFARGFPLRVLRGNPLTSFSSLCPFPSGRLCILSAVVQGSGLNLIFQSYLSPIPNLANPIRPVPLASKPHRGPNGAARQVALLFDNTLTFDKWCLLFGPQRGVPGTFLRLSQWR